MKILHCVGWTDLEFNYRQNYYTSELSKTDEVILLTSFGSHKPKFAGRNDAIIESEPEYIHRRKALIDWKGFIYFKFMDVLLNFKPDIVHLYEAGQGVTYMLARACVKLNIPYVYEHEQRSDGISLLSRIRSRLFIRRWIRWAAANAELVRVVTPGAASYVEDISGKKCCHVTTLAFDTSRSFFDSSLRESFRSEFNISNRTALCITGTFPWAKRIDIVLSAFIDALVDRPDLILFVAGLIPAAQKDKITSFVSHTNIIFFDRMLNGAELNRLFCGCDAALWTKPTISFFEALGTGLPIYIPYGQGTSHLDGELITHFGKSGGIEERETVISDADIIRDELTNLMVGLKIISARLPDNRFTSSNIVFHLRQQYVKISENLIGV
jgi:hypothetical protein